MDDEETFNYSDVEDGMDEDPEDEDYHQHHSILMGLVEAGDWAGCLTRVNSHPTECHEVQQGMGRTPLHVACDNDAPAVVIQAMLQAYPEASVRTGAYDGAG